MLKIHEKQTQMDTKSVLEALREHLEHRGAILQKQKDFLASASPTYPIHVEPCWTQIGSR